MREEALTSDESVAIGTSNKDVEYFTPDLFSKRLAEHRKKHYKHERTITATKAFLNHYDMMSDEQKERAISTLAVIQNAKIPKTYGLLASDGIRFVADICGLRIVYYYDAVLQSLMLYHISPGKSPTDHINVSNKTEFGNLSRKQIALEEEMLDFTPYTIMHGFASLYEMEQCRKQKNLESIKDLVDPSLVVQ